MSLTKFSCSFVRFRGSFVAPNLKLRQHPTALLTPRSVPATAALLRDERIKRCIAKHPKEKHESKQGPDVLRREGIPSDRLSAEHRVCVAHERVQEERQRQNQERIQLKSCGQVAVQQLVKPTRRTAAWTGKTGQRAKWTTRDESRLARLNHKKKNAGDGDGQPKQEYA